MLREDSAVQTTRASSSSTVSPPARICGFLLYRWELFCVFNPRELNFLSSCHTDDSMATWRHIGQFLTFRRHARQSILVSTLIISDKCTTGDLDMLDAFVIIFSIPKCNFIYKFHYTFIEASRPLTGSPMDLPTFFFFSPSVAENGIPGGQTHGCKPWIDLIFNFRKTYL